VLRGERAVAGQGLLARLAAGDDVGQLAAQREAEVEGGADALGGRREAVAGAVADEEDAVLGPGADLVWDPVALPALGGDADIGGELERRLLDVVLGVEGPDADAQLAVGRERPRVAALDVLRIDPQLEVGSGRVGVDLQAAREPRVGRLDVGSGGKDPPPAHGVDDERGAQVAPVGVDGVAGAGGRAFDRRGLELRRALRLLAQQGADAAVVERRERPRQGPAHTAPGHVDDEVRERLLDGAHEPEVLEPLRRRGARARLALADLVAVDHQHAGRRPRQLARDGEPREARSADEDVPLTVQRCALVTPLRRSNWHVRQDCRGANLPYT